MGPSRGTKIDIIQQTSYSMSYELFLKHKKYMKESYIETSVF